MDDDRQPGDGQKVALFGALVDALEEIAYFDQSEADAKRLARAALDLVGRAVARKKLTEDWAASNPPGWRPPCGREDN